MRALCGPKRGAQANLTRKRKQKKLREAALWTERL
jgi:hypothetical protein